MDVLEKRVKVKTGDTVHIIPIGDTHVGNICFDRPYFEEMVEWILAQKNTYVCGMGDLVDAVTHMDVNRYDIENVDHEFNTPEKQHKYISKWFGKLAAKEKLLFLLEGNHEYEIKHRYNHEHCNRWSAEMNVPAPGYQCMMRFTMEENYNTKKNKAHSYDIFAHHGHGGAGRTGNAVNKIQRFAENYLADIYMMGHTHDKFANIEARVKMADRPDGDGNIQLSQKKIAFINTGTFMDTFKVGASSTYAERKGFQVKMKGVVKIMLKDGDIHLRP